MPDRSRDFGVCLGGRDKDTLFAFCGNKTWKRKVKTTASSPSRRGAKSTAAISKPAPLVA